MLKEDNRKFKAEMIELIDSIDLERPSRVESIETFHEAAHALIKSHKVTINASSFVKQMSMLIMANNKVRAMKLVKVLPDASLSTVGSWLALSGVGVLGLSLLAAFILFVAWVAR